MKKEITGFILSLILAFCFSSISYAGGPLVVKSGMAISYGKRPYLYRYDKGPLGMFSNTEAVQIIEDLYSDWQEVPTTELKFKRDDPGSLEFDVTKDNYAQFLKTDDLLGYTAVIFDDDGTLLDDFIGKGAGNHVLGLSGPISVNAGELANQIAESQAVFNGKFVNGIKTPNDPESTVDAFKGTIIHETGHGIGLDHSQINVEAIKAGTSQEIKDTVPLEFPVAVTDLYLIRRDDASSVSFLYPNESGLSKFGKIKGKVLRKDGITPVLGANVIARNINDPLLEAISCVSDFLQTGTGEFILFAVPPGKYRVEIEPIDPSFTDQSGVGPYSESSSSESFKNPVPKGFYTGSNQPLTTDKDKALLVEVQAGQTVNNINIIANTTFSPGSSSSGEIVNVSEIEPNDSPEEAQFITPPVKVSGTASSIDDGVIELSSDTGSKLILSDLYKFNLSMANDISAVLTIESDINTNDLDLALLNQDGTMILEASSETGNVDEIITTSLDAGTYLLGTGAFSGNANYKLELTTTGSEVVPELSLSGPDSLILKRTGMNNLMITATALNFLTPTKCMVISSNSEIAKVRPKSFMLSQAGNTKKIRVKVPMAKALELIDNDQQIEVTITVKCGESILEEFDIKITPTVDEVLPTRKRNWVNSRTRK